MWRLLQATVLAGGAMLLVVVGAHAQPMDPPDKPAPRALQSDDELDLTERYPQGPRVYGFYREDGQWVRSFPQRRGGCGTYFFWNGERCVDARNR